MTWYFGGWYLPSVRQAPKSVFTAVTSFLCQEDDIVFFALCVTLISSYVKRRPLTSCALVRTSQNPEANETLEKSCRAWWLGIVRFVYNQLTEGRTVRSVEGIFREAFGKVARLWKKLRRTVMLEWWSLTLIMCSYIKFRPDGNGGWSLRCKEAGLEESYLTSTRIAEPLPTWRMRSKRAYVLPHWRVWTNLFRAGSIGSVHSATSLLTEHCGTVAELKLFRVPVSGSERVRFIVEVFVAAVAVICFQRPI